jgi:hypothetical protein
VADAVVDRLEIVDVDDDERQPPLVALGPGRLPRERLVKEAPVVEAGEVVEIPELACFAKTLSVLDRGSAVRGELLELGELVAVAARADPRQKTASVPTVSSSASCSGTAIPPRMSVESASASSISS